MADSQEMAAQNAAQNYMEYLEEIHRLKPKKGERKVGLAKARRPAMHCRKPLKVAKILRVDI